LIREATAADMPAVWNLVAELAEFERLSDHLVGSADDLARHLGKHFYCFVYERSGSVLGYCLGFNTYSTFRTQPGLWLEDLYVTPAERGKGVGKAMLQFLIDWCEREQFGRLEWSVLDWNENAIGFYERMGATLLPDWRICRISFSTKSDGAASA
jgi:GNAT superfamily N-acetyltransferase